MNIINRLINPIRKLIPRLNLYPRPFTGSIFDRFDGLDFVLPKCKDCKVLDFGSSQGLVSYEFARAGAKLIHGFEINIVDVLFSRKLFKYVPAKSKFINADLSLSGKKFKKKYSHILHRKYDIVLFLGIYHVLANQMPEKELHSLVKALMSLTDNYFVVRTDMLPDFESIILEGGFEEVHTNVLDNDSSKCAGLTKVYQLKKGKKNEK